MARGSINTGVVAAEITDHSKVTLVGMLKMSGNKIKVKIDGVRDMRPCGQEFHLIWEDNEEW